MSDSEYTEVTYEVTVYVPEDEPLPDEGNMARALYQAIPEVDTESGVEVRRLG